MALLDEVVKSNMIKGVAVGVGVALLTPVLLPIVASAARPAARAAAKTGMILYEKGRETVAEVAEVVDDLVAEARADLQRGEMAAEDKASTGAPDIRTDEAPAAPE